MNMTDKPELDESVEFARKWSAINAKLTHDEQDIVAEVVSGSEVNHSLLYCVVFFIVGAVAGASGAFLLG